MTIQDRLSEIEERANKACEVYDMLSPEHRNIALANYTMGEEYIVDVPKLVKALQVVVKILKYTWPGEYGLTIKQFNEQVLTEIERILNAEGDK